jgi:hypothetical protein
VLAGPGLLQKGKDVVASQNEIALAKQAVVNRFARAVHSRSILGIQISQKTAFVRVTDREMASA